MNAKALSEDQLNLASGGLSPEEARSIEKKVTDMRNEIEGLRAALNSEQEAHKNTKYELGRYIAQSDDVETNIAAKERSTYYKNIGQAGNVL